MVVLPAWIERLFDQPDALYLSERLHRAARQLEVWANDPDALTRRAAALTDGTAEPFRVGDYDDLPNGDYDPSQKVTLALGDLMEHALELGRAIAAGAAIGR